MSSELAGEANDPPSEPILSMRDSCAKGMRKDTAHLCSPFPISDDLRPANAEVSSKSQLYIFIYIKNYNVFFGSHLASSLASMVHNGNPQYPLRPSGKEPSSFGFLV